MVILYVALEAQIGELPAEYKLQGGCQVATSEHLFSVKLKIYRDCYSYRLNYIDVRHKLYL